MIYQPFYYFASADTFPNDKERLGRWLGVSHRVGQGLCYHIVNDNGQVISYLKDKSYIEFFYLSATKRIRKRALQYKVPKDMPIAIYNTNKKSKKLN